MAEETRAGLTIAQGRRFAFTVGGAFLVFSGIAWWRDHGPVAAVLAALGLTLAAAGVFVPASLGPVERAWMRLAHLISKVTTPIVMGVMYLLVITPVGAVKRAMSGDSLRHERGATGFWRERAEGHRRTTSMRRQF
ncbi:MAG: SxtJ family membrane protein [Vicinamibacterales bacterium]